MALKISTALKTILSGCFLYQNIHIDIREIISLADEQFPAQALEEEFTYRPWTPHSHHKGYTESEERIHASASVGLPDPLGAPPKEMHLPFLLPTVNTWCDVCRLETTQDSIPHINCSPYHLNPKAIEEPPGYQTFLFNFQCHQCKGPPVTFIARRELLKLQLCGRSAPYFPPIPPAIPKALNLIYRDAVTAAACGDISGALYHLRTLLEHHMKSAADIPLEERLEGDELCSCYHALLERIVVDRAALTNVFAQCSKWLHSRGGRREDFERTLTAIHGHFELIAALKRVQG